MLNVWLLITFDKMPVLLRRCKAKQNQVMTEKRIIRRVLIFCLLYFFMNIVNAQKVNTVVLDAGHGGHDTGALGKNSREKDITLAVVLKLRDYIQENMKDVKVILTRDDDTFIELYRRARIANENKADLFISVHCNSTKTTSVYGVETFVMGLHKSEANLAVAKAENAAILLEDDYVEKYDGFDPNSPEGNIFFSMMQNAFLDKSLDFAGKVQHQLVDNLKMLNRGVKQAGFLVLFKTAMPGVLIETGFISNAKDEKFLLSDKGQDQMAQAIFKALRDYKNQVEKRPKEQGYSDTLLVVNHSSEIPNNKNTSKTLPENNPQVLKPEPVKIKKVEADAVTFRVQFVIFPDEKPLDSKIFDGIEDVKMYYHGGSYKYTSGEFITMEEASQWRKTIISKGYKDAFVVAFKGKDRITNEEAKRLTEKK
jgi:N-acetylmuramoyl-L-alanine amidase